MGEISRLTKVKKWLQGWKHTRSWVDDGTLVKAFERANQLQDISVIWYSR